MTAAVVREVRALAADGLLSSGIQVAARVRGAPLVSVWGGCCARTARPVGETSLFHPWSVSKGVASTALCIVAAREGISFDDKVTRVWERFGRRGKADTTIAEAVGYRGGMPQHPPLASQALDTLRGGWRRHWEAGISWIEEYEPEWVPGTRAAYHPMSYSWIVGGIVERADAKRRHVRHVVSEGVYYLCMCIIYILYKY
jgi:CubicO group peptidase (beta-lactamase class C family)